MLSLRAMNQVTVQEAIRIAIGHHQAGRLPEAEAIYRQVLQHQPDYPDALHLLGVIALQVGQHQAAAELIGRAVAVAPDAADYYPNLGEALRNLDRLEDAAAALQRAIALNPNLVAAYNNLGIVLKQLKRYDEAIVVCRRAVELNPRHFQALNNLAAACKLNGDNAAAIGYYRQALAVNPDSADICNNLGAALQDEDNDEEALVYLRRAIELKPDLNPAHALVLTLQKRVRADAWLTSQDMAGWEDWGKRHAAAPKISVIVCSIDEAKLEKVRNNFSERLNGENWELIAIRDARSLCEGYNRGIRQSSGEILIFAHDDIEILSPDFRHKLKCYLNACDVLGVAGTRRLIGPSWVNAGWPWLHGQVVHPDGAAWKICLYGVTTPLQMDIQALDGLFFACRREVAEKIGFDENTFDGFHFYDLDFTFSAYRAGFRLGVANDIAVIHYSEGNYNATWEGYAQRFLAKHGAALEQQPHAKDLRILAQVETKTQALSFCNLYLINNYPGNNYADWVRVFDTPSVAELDQQRAASREWAAPPLLSILMPVYNAPEIWLRRALDSVLAQTWPHWELCIADDASPAIHVRTVLDEYQRRDARIKVIYRATNGHISAASNSALELATGQFTALLDHDDELPPHALYRVAQEIAAHPDCALIYSDEDKLTPDGRRKDAYFKPDWNPDLFLSQNTLSHLGVYRTALIRDIGGFRESYEGSQDYDLALRAIERIKPEQIHHIPQVLYHWRAIEGSTAAVGGVVEKPYAVKAALKALGEHLQRTGQDATVAESPEADGAYRVSYRLPSPPPLVSLIIPTRNGLELLRQCIDSLLAQTRYPNYEILVIDNDSDDPATLDYLTALRDQGHARILRDPQPFNYSALNNAAVREARGELIGLLNNDLEVLTPDWLDEMAGHAVRPEIGAVGARLWYPDDTLQHGGVVLVGGVAGHAHKNLKRGKHGYFQRGILTQNLSAVTAACLVMRKAVFEEVGGLDETLTVAFNDVDLCLKIRAHGHRIVWTPYAELYHHESATRGNDDTPEKSARFSAEIQIMQQRWGALLRNDPAYNPNLTLDRENYSLAWPPRV